VAGGVGQEVSDRGLPCRRSKAGLIALEAVEHLQLAVRR
jgi:hypothetical protein